MTNSSVTALETASRTRPDLALGLACLCPPKDPQPLKTSLGLRAIHCNDAYATAERIAAIHAAGLGVAVAVATVNDGPRIAALLALGTDGVMTDHAAFARMAG